MTPLLLALALWTAPPSAISPNDYLERYFTTFPSRATAAGRHDHDRDLEDLSAERRAEWLMFNLRSSVSFRKQVRDDDLPPGDRLDAELLLRQTEGVRMTYQTLRLPERSPLYWTGLLSNATVLLLVRDDLPLTERLKSAAARARLLPRLARQAREALASTDPSLISPEISAIASRQVRGSARFYAEGFAKAAADAELRKLLNATGKAASQALSELADFLDELAGKASGSPRLGGHYAALSADHRHR